MKTQDELKNELTSTLHKNPELETFFGKYLKERINGADWLENDLILVLLKGSKVNIDLLKGLITIIKKHPGPLLDKLAGGLSGKELGSDEKLSDALAEIHGVSWLTEQQYVNIEKISATSIKQTPDFKAKKNGNLELFEVKNLQKPTDLMDLAFRKIEAARLLDPERFDNLTIIVDVTSTSDNNLNDTDRKQVDNLVKIINNSSVCNGESSVSYFSDVNKIIQKSIKFKWQQGRGSIVGHRGKYMFTDDPKRFKKLRGVVNKTWVKVGEAINQLESYDDVGDKKWILLNWQRPDEYLFDTELANRFEQIIKQIDVQVKLIDPNLNVVLMR